ncbi:MAG: helix-turn-helix domain-containing protein [Clostridia bacterium]|nr:helix-turn-helix domain-containing protein [Clostridia bacterium]
MLSENIKVFRMKKGLTQKDLADFLSVTPQAVSRWESGDVEPSVATMQDMAKIFGVSMDVLVGDAIETETETAAAATGKVEMDEQELEKIADKVVQKQKPVLAVCEQCNKPIYEGNDIVRKTRHIGHTSHSYVICSKCEAKNKEQARIRAIESSKKCRTRAYAWSAVIAALIVGILVAGTKAAKLGNGYMILSIVVGVLFFPFLSCLFLQNNFVEDMFGTVTSWGFVELPGIIFELDLEGIVWLLTVKLLFWILGILLAIATFILAVILGLVVSFFVYPFALAKSYKHPELTEAI